MRSILHVVFAVAVISGVALVLAALSRIVRVTRAATAIPVYPGAHEGGGRTRYLPHLLSWDDRSSARVQRVFALSQATSLVAIARNANQTLVAGGWYLVTPDDLERTTDPKVIVWQRDPDERLDLTQVWPINGMTREQRLYGGVFPEKFLDAPLVFEWSWALRGPRSPRPVRGSWRPVVRSPVPPSLPSR